MAMAHQKEKGAIIGYVLVGALLTTALAGGVYVMRHGTTSTGDATQTAKTNDKANSKDSVDTVLKQQADKNKADTKKAEDKKPTEEKAEQKTGTTTPAPAPVQTQPSNQASVTPATTPTTSTSPNSGLPHTSTAPATNQLPATGPGETVVVAVAGVILLGVSMAYIRSRRLI